MEHYKAPSKPPNQMNERELLLHCILLLDSLRGRPKPSDEDLMFGVGEILSRLRVLDEQ